MAWEDRLMRCACLLLIAGCGFSSQPGAADDPGSPGGSNGPGGSGGGSGSASTCDASNPTPLLCVSFGTNPLVQDLATPAHDLLEHTGILPLANIALPVTGFVVQTAGTFSATSQLRFKERPDLDVDDLTIDLWMSPQGGPAENGSWMLDNNTEYYAAYNGDRTVRCGVGDTAVDSNATVAAGAWHHVACTYGKGDHLLRVYVDGDLSGCHPMAPGVPHGAKDGVAIGANFDPKSSFPLSFQQHFVGSLGHVHVYGTELAPDQICRAAGRTGCSIACPGSGSSDGGERGDPGGPG